MNEGIRLKVDERVVKTGSGIGRTIMKGDRMCARMLFANGEMLMFQSREVYDMTDMLSAIRRECRGRRGLMRLFIRNATRGWSIERPMMLYGEEEVFPNINKRRAWMGTTRISGSMGSAVVNVHVPQPRPRMLMPWETH